MLDGFIHFPEHLFPTVEPCEPAISLYKTLSSASKNQSFERWWASSSDFCDRYAKKTSRDKTSSILNALELMSTKQYVYFPKVWHLIGMLLPRPIAELETWMVGSGPRSVSPSSAESLDFASHLGFLCLRVTAVPLTWTSIALCVLCDATLDSRSVAAMRPP